MSRKRIEIDPECGRRLKELLIENKMTQIELSKRLNCEAQHISNIVRGKRNLTLDMAQRIVGEVFPGCVLIEWLLHLSDFKTQADKDENSKKAWAELRQTEIFYDKVFRCFIDSIESLCGYGFHSQETDSLIGDYIAVNDSTGEKVGVIPTKSFERLRCEIENFASYSINLLIKNEMCPLPKSMMDGASNG